LAKAYYISDKAYIIFTYHQVTLDFFQLNLEDIENTFSTFLQHG